MSRREEDLTEEELIWGSIARAGDSLFPAIWEAAVREEGEERRSDSGFQEKKPVIF